MSKGFGAAVPLRKASCFGGTLPHLVGMKASEGGHINQHCEGKRQSP